MDERLKVKMPTPRGKSKKQEKRLAKEIGGRTTIASGALWWDKGDLSNDRFLIEAKRTDSNKFRLEKRIWEKIRSEAIGCGRIPLLLIEIGNFEVVCTSLNYYRELTGNFATTKCFSSEVQSITITPNSWDDEDDVSCILFRFCDSDTMIIGTKRTFFTDANVI